MLDSHHLQQYVWLVIVGSSSIVIVYLAGHCQDLGVIFELVVILNFVLERMVSSVSSSSAKSSFLVSELSSKLGIVLEGVLTIVSVLGIILSSHLRRYE
jgi:hypothetical protein